MSYVLQSDHYFLETQNVDDSKHRQPRIKSCELFKDTKELAVPFFPPLFWTHMKLS